MHASRRAGTVEREVAARAGLGKATPVPAHAAALALQRTAGNAATAFALRHGGPVPVVVQRYQLIHSPAGSPPADATFWDRFHGVGFVGASNRGWVDVGAPNAATQRHHATSVHDEAHTEEALLRWAQAQGAAPGVAPAAPGPALRVIALYTERRPCVAGDADAQRAQRPPGNCDALLAQRLHATTPVYYSVANSPLAHNTLMFTHAQRNVRVTEVLRLTDEYARRLPAMRRAGVHVTFTTLRDTWRTAIMTAAAPATTEDYNPWVAAIRDLADQGIRALQEFAVPDPVPHPRAAPPGPKPGPGPGGGSGTRDDPILIS